ncbi:MAG TPA: putative ABC exporter domain-containing protein [Feifaniaceae bacterium]|nr:putative ABC exporter domain-containing protein [Feifaniaceae bacterium]
MRAIVYLWMRSLKNRFLLVLKKPAVLVLYLLLFGFAAYMLFGPAMSSEAPPTKEIAGYSAILFGVFFFIAGMSVMTGLKQGTALFSMADVNFLFVAPVSPRKILLGGILKQAGILLAASVFMIFQYPNMRNAAGLDGYALLGLMAAYALIGFASQILSALLYAFCAGSPKRRSYVNSALLLICAGVVGGFLLFLPGQGEMQDALTRYFAADAWNYFPFVGWARGLAVSFAAYRWGSAALYAVLTLLGTLVCALLLQRTSMDYFEDVLLAAERANQKQEDAKAGRATAQGDVSAKIKRDKGPLYGTGALAFTGRILREQSRGGVFLLDLYSLGALAGPVMAMLFLPGEVLEDGWLWGVLNMSVWMMMFLNTTTGVARELQYPVLYLAPVNAWSKLMAVLLPQLLKALADGVLFALLGVALFHGTFPEGVAAVLCYASISLLYMAGMLIVERMLGPSKNKALVITIYIILLLLLVMPGMIGSMILSESIPGLTTYFLFIAWNTIVAMLIVLFSRGMLHNMDLA